MPHSKNHQRNSFEKHTEQTVMPTNNLDNIVPKWIQEAAMPLLKDLAGSEELLERYPNFPCGVEANYDKEFMRQEMYAIRGSIENQTCHGSPVTATEIRELLGNTGILLLFFRALEKGIPESEECISMLKNNEGSIAEALENPYTPKDTSYNDDKIYFFHEDANTIAEYARGFTDDEEQTDDSDDTENEDDNDSDERVAKRARIN